MAFTQFELSRSFWDFAFENPEKVKTTHIAIFFFSIEHCNRLGWKDKFGLPTSMVLEAIGVNSYNTYKKHFDDLATWGFFKIIELSKNQYSSNVVALSTALSKNVKALDKALIKHTSKHLQSTSESICSIDKQVTKEQVTSNKILKEESFEIFWKVYAKKVDRHKCEKAFNKISDSDISDLLSKVHIYVNSKPDIQFRKNPLTWLNGRCWNDEILTDKPPPKQTQFTPEELRQWERELALTNNG